jgi:hypothetical protein
MTVSTVIVLWICRCVCVWIEESDTETKGYSTDRHTKEERIPNTIQMQKLCKSKNSYRFYIVLSEYLFQCDAEVFFVVVPGANCCTCCLRWLHKTILKSLATVAVAIMTIQLIHEHSEYIQLTHQQQYRLGSPYTVIKITLLYCQVCLT